MVKKIRLIEEEDSAEELDQKEFQAKMLEYQQSIDWKLWEMLKIMQAWATREGIIKLNEAAPTEDDKEPEYDVKSIIVDEDE